MIGKYGRTVRASLIKRTFSKEFLINEGRTRRASVPVKWEIRRESVSSELQNVRTSEHQNSYFYTPQGICFISEITLNKLWGIN